jgi:hypothetical protein
MADRADAYDVADANALDREMGLVREAIAMVAAGGSRRVVVAGIRFGSQLLVPARRLALESGVRVLVESPTMNAGVALAVERIRE